MKEWEMAAEVVVGGGVGIYANKNVSIPVSTGNGLLDSIIDVGIGLGIAYLGMKYVGREVGLAAVAFGGGWALSAGAGAVGINL